MTDKTVPLSPIQLDKKYKLESEVAKLRRKATRDLLMQYGQKGEHRKISSAWLAETIELSLILADNPEIESRIHQFQLNHALPLSQTNDFESWISQRDNTILDSIRAEANKLVIEYSLDSKWIAYLDALILTGSVQFNPAAIKRFVFPDVTFEPSTLGRKWVMMVKVSADTPVENTIWQNHLKDLCDLLDDPPPHPEPLLGNSRANDWLPLALWRLRHPTVTIEEISKLLGRNRVNVTRKLKAAMRYLGLSN